VQKHLLLNVQIKDVIGHPWDQNIIVNMVLFVQIVEKIIVQIVIEVKFASKQTNNISKF
jgi:hypothetical protein